MNFDVTYYLQWTIMLICVADVRFSLAPWSFAVHVRPLPLSYRVRFFKVIFSPRPLETPDQVYSMMDSLWRNSSGNDRESE